MARRLLRLVFGVVTLFTLILFAKDSQQQKQSSRRSPYSYIYPGSRPAPSDVSVSNAVAAVAAAESAAAVPSRPKLPFYGMRKQSGGSRGGARSMTGAPTPKGPPRDKQPATNPFVSGSFEPDYTGVESKVVVLRQTAAENTSWVHDEVPGWQPVIYSSDFLPGTRQLVAARGREANAYLTYILEHYDSLPDVVAFVHAHREAWHVDRLGSDQHDNGLALRRLRVQYVREEGYANLRCQLEPGCPIFYQDNRRRAPDDPHRPYDEAYRRAWPELFPGLATPAYVSAPCCAQFAVTREQILARPRDDYLRYWTWLMETPFDDHMAGTVMEYMWHIIFGRESEYCPDPWDCYCNTYGEECYDLEYVGGSTYFK